LIKIGDFARLSQVSVVTLRHYDEIGLLKPISVDAFTGYRYYSVAQLPRLNRILALKDLGFSLDQIEVVLASDLTLDQLRAMLMQKRAEVEQQVEEAQGRIRRIEARLSQIEQENSMPDYEVVLKTVPPIRIASRKVTIPTNDQVPEYLGVAYRDVYGHISQQRGKALEPCFAMWHQGADVLTDEVAEAAVPLEQLVPESDTVRVYELPQTQVASVIHHGEFENFTQAHTALLKWIEANGYRIVGAYRELYIAHDHDDMSNSATEIQYPVEKA
jgi:DNA-binding transcriptional MerR regulator/effector-binding domain-containing protein